MAPYFSTLAWKIPWMEEPGRLQSMGSRRVRHDWGLHFHFSLSCIGEGNGNPLQCSCLENPRDGGAWWAVVYGVAQSRTRLKRLSSSVYMPRFDSWVGKIPWRRERLPIPIFWLGEFHGLYSPWGSKESDRTERLSLSLLRYAAAAKSLQSCPTLCDPMACSLPGSPVRGIFQARVLEWIAIAFSNGLA